MSHFGTEDVGLFQCDTGARGAGLGMSMLERCLAAARHGNVRCRSKAGSVPTTFIQPHPMSEPAAQRSAARSDVRQSTARAGSFTSEGEDKAGFAEEAIPHIGAVYRFALRLSRGNEAAAEDLVQDTYLRAYRSWESYARGTRCRSWLFTICRNLAVRRAESRSLRLEVPASTLGLDDGSLVSDSALTPGSTQGNPETDYFERRIDDEVLSAIAQLPAEYREAVILCDLEGLAYRDIARMLGVAGGTIKSRIHRGRRILSETLHSYAVDMGYRPAVRHRN